MNKRRIIVCVQGLGFVGSAMATAIAIAKNTKKEFIYDVIGVDLPTLSGKARVNSINKGIFPFSTDDLMLTEALAEAHARGNLLATVDDDAYATADIIVIDVHFDINYLDNEPQLSLESFTHALVSVGKKMKDDVLIIIETTVPPGACEKIIYPIFSGELKKRGLSEVKFKLAHSYERVMPGDNYLSSITDYWRVYAGYNEIAAKACEKFLKTIINVKKYPLTRLNSTTASETAKVLENTYRAVNIAFIDEWTKYAEKVGIDLFEIVDAIRQRPTHSNIRYPGLGVGGYCLTKDPTFAPAAAKQIFGFDLQFPFSRLAIQINNEMPCHAIALLKDMFLALSLFRKKILICGASYRQNVDDTRYSPSEILMNKLLEEGADVEVHDPYVKEWPEFNLKPLQNLPSSSLYDAIIFAVPHKFYRELDIVNWVTNKMTIILDANNIFSKHERQLARDAGIIIESIGRGRGL